MSDLDVRKQPYVWDLASNNYRGMFLMGEMKANFGTGEPMKGDADRDGEPLVSSTSSAHSRTLAATSKW